MGVLCPAVWQQFSSSRLTGWSAMRLSTSPTHANGSIFRSSQEVIRRLASRSIYIRGSGERPDGKFVSDEAVSLLFSRLGASIASSASDAEFLVELDGRMVTFGGKI